METKPSLGVLMGQGVDPAQAEAANQDDRRGPREDRSQGALRSQRRIFLSDRCKCVNRTLSRLASLPQSGLFVLKMVQSALPMTTGTGGDNPRPLDQAED